MNSLTKLIEQQHASEQLKKQEEARKRSSSVIHLKTGSVKTAEITKFLVIKASDISSYFSIFLSNSKGKDKFLSLFQYVFQFICTCAKHSNIEQNAIAVRERKIIDIVIYYNLKENISQARKVFRLLRFLDQIKGMRKILKTNKPILFKILSVITYFFSISYYISDNTLWFINILVTSSALPKVMKKSWKRRKNFTSLNRLIFYLIILVYSIWLQRRENQKLRQALRNSQAFGHQNSKALKVSKLLMQGRRNERFLYLEITLSLTRVVMLISTLRLKWHDKLDPIFVGLCGVSSSIMGFLKAFYEKRIILNLDKQPDNIENEIQSLSQIKQSPFKNIVSQLLEFSKK